MFRSAQKEPRQTLRQYLRNVSQLSRGKSTDSLRKENEENSNPLKNIENKALQLVEICSSISTLNLQKVRENSFLIECCQELQKFCDKIRDFFTNEKAKIERHHSQKSVVNSPSPKIPKTTKVKSRKYIESTSIFQKGNSKQIFDTSRFTKLQQSLASNKIAQPPTIKKEQPNPEVKDVQAPKRIENLFGSRTIPSYQIINVDGFSGNNRKRKRRMGEVFQNFD